MTDFMNINGIRIEYKWFGNRAADKPVMVLLHEGLGCVDTWRNFPQDLSDSTGHAVFAYSRHGYGRSDSKTAPWSIRYMHDEGLISLPRILEAAGLTDVVLLGHSDGASIALIYAGGVESHHARGLILMAPHVFNESVCVTGIERAREAYLKSDLRIRLARYHGDNVDGAFWGWNGAWLNPAFLKWNIESFLPQVAVPVLAVQGVQDQYGTLAQIDAVDRQIRGPSRRLVLDQCAHSPHQDQPDKLKSAIRQFLGVA